GIVAAFDKKPANVILALAAHGTVCERKVQIHAVAVTRKIVVEAGPGPRGEQFFAHRTWSPFSSSNQPTQLTNLTVLTRPARTQLRGSATPPHAWAGAALGWCRPL